MDNPQATQSRKPPVLAPGHTFATVTDKISAIVLSRRTTLGWVMGFGIGLLLTGLLLVAVSYLLIKGVGIWGINIPIG